MVSKQIKPHLWSVCAVDEGLRTFCGNSYTEHGMMYHSYLMETELGFLPLGVPPARHVAEWLACVKTLVGSSAVCWLALLGAPDDRTAVNAVLEEYPHITLIGGQTALFQLEGFLKHTVKSIPIRGKRKLNLGGRELVFQTLPGKTGTSNVYILESDMLFTADAFGAYFACAGLLTSTISEKANYLHGAAQYHSGIGGDLREKTMECAVSLVRENQISMICPTVGPVVDAYMDDLLEIYCGARVRKDNRPVIALLYTSGGYVEELMTCVAAGIADSGDVTAEKINLNTTDRELAIRKAAWADAVLFGTSDADGAAKPIWDVVTSLRPEACKGKIAAAVYSVQSRDCEPTPLRAYLNALDFDLNIPDSIIQGKPDRQTLENAYEYGYAVGCSLQKIPNTHKPKYVKCLVCGEIFDASLSICPVCGVGLDQCVAVDEELVLFREDTNNRYVILGGGIAALSAAEAIRSRDKTGTILMISAEPHLPINRPMLTKDMKAVITAPENQCIHDWEWYDEQNISLRLDCTVTNIDIRMKKVRTVDGETIPYDKLIYAMGAECFVPPIPGRDKQGVITIRHLSDTAKLGQWLSTAKNAVVIGGGVLGLEAASELMRAGIRVTILEAAPQIVGRQVDEISSAFLRHTLVSMGAACHEGVSIASIEGEEYVSGVRLADGKFFAADFVVVSCGNRANVQVAKDAGIAVERAIVVDQYMKTSEPDIFACGDCAQYDGVNYQLWQEASAQGKVAGANAAGDKAVYTNALLGMNLEGFGTTLFAIGDPGKRMDIPYRTVNIWDDVTGRRETYWFYGGSLQGAVLIRSPEKVAEVSQAVTSHARYEELF